jgi:hypothetical protein
MALIDLIDWLDDFTGPEFIWCAKRLSANDTQANGSHQAGTYIPKAPLFEVFPELKSSEAENPRIQFNLRIDSHSDSREATVIWYNQKTRNETRITNLGGTSSALLDPENTGALTIFIFTLNKQNLLNQCHAWVCRHEVEEDMIENRIGVIEPGQWRIWRFDTIQNNLSNPKRNPCTLNGDEIPLIWLDKFPSGLDIIYKTLELQPDNGLDPDKRLIKRRKCEFDIFLSLEAAIEMPHIQAGFKTIDEFISRAQTILQRRKARSGRSLELHVKEIFKEESLIENRDFSHQPISEDGQRPDFLFPSEAAYKNLSYPQKNLRMLAVKTTCKDRWRQILKEADRVPVKHLLTLQEGVSENQFNEMASSGVQLVVPEPLHSKYSKNIQPKLLTLESFIANIRLLSL